MLRFIVLTAILIAVFMGIIVTGFNLIGTVSDHKFDYGLDEDGEDL